MFKNYYLFDALVKEIRREIVGQSIDRIFTYRKNEVTLELSNALFLHLSIDANTPYLLLKKAKHINQHHFNLFGQILGQTIEKIFFLNFDKHLILATEKFRLEAIFYAPFNNVFLITPQGSILETFKEKTPYPQYSIKQESGLDLRSVTEEQLQALLHESPQTTVLHFLNNNLAALNKTIIKEILFRSDLEATRTINTLKPTEQASITHTILQIGKLLASGKAFLHFVENGQQVQKIALFPLQHLGTKTQIKTYNSINQALNDFYYLRQIKQQFEKLKASCESALQKRLTYLQKSLKKLQENANLQKRKAESELKGNLLLTFKNQIPQGVREIELPNIFSEQQEKIKIKLNPSKNVVANAERYFNKFKNLKQDQQVLQIKIDTFQKEIAELLELQSQLKKVTSLPRLKTFYKRLVQMGLLQDHSKKEQKIPAENLKYAFNRLILDGAWDVYIGKDGPSNDLLTFHFANKWDIWLHAQGVAGAHVLIRVPNRNQTPPAHVIEQAARLAAAHSKAKNASTVPVMYTQVRYVSRIRKAPPGTVKVNHEKVLFVEPMKIN